MAALFCILVVMATTCCYLSYGQQNPQYPPPPPPINPGNSERLQKLRQDALRLAMFRTQLRNALLSGGLNLNGASPGAILSRLQNINQLGNQRVKPIDLRQNPEVLQTLRKNKVPIVVLNPNLIHEAEKFSKGMPVPSLPNPGQTTTTAASTSPIVTTTSATTTTTTTVPATSKMTLRPFQFAESHARAGTQSRIGGQSGMHIDTPKKFPIRLTGDRVPIPPQVSSRTRIDVRQSAPPSPGFFSRRGGNKHNNPFTRSNVPYQKGAKAAPYRPTEPQNSRPVETRNTWQTDRTQRINGNIIPPRTDQVNDVRSGQVGNARSFQNPNKRVFSNNKKGMSNVDTLKVTPESSPSPYLRKTQNIISTPSDVKLTGKKFEVSQSQPLSQILPSNQPAEPQISNVPPPTIPGRGGISATKRNLNPIPTANAQREIPLPEVAKKSRDSKLVIPIPGAKQADLPGPPKLILPLPGIAGPSGSNKNVSLGNRPSLMLPIRIKLSGPASMPLTVRFDAPPVIYLRLHLEFPGGLKIPFRVPVSIDGLSLPQNVNVGLGMDVLGEGKVMMPDKKVVKLDQQQAFDSFSLSKLSSQNPLAEALKQSLSSLDKSQMPWMPPSVPDVTLPPQTVTQTATATATATAKTTPKSSPAPETTTGPVTSLTTGAPKPTNTDWTVTATATATANSPTGTTTPAATISTQTNSVGKGFQFASQKTPRHGFPGRMRPTGRRGPQWNLERGKMRQRLNIRFPSKVSTTPTQYVTATATATSAPHSKSTTGQFPQSTMAPMAKTQVVTVNVSASANSKQSAIPSATGHGHVDGRGHGYTP